MIAATLLLAVGLGDLARGARSVAVGWVLAVLAWGAVLALALSAGAQPLAAVLAIAVAVGWSIAAEGGSGIRSTPLPAVAVLVVATGAAVVADGALGPAPSTPIGDGLAAAFGGLPAAEVLLVAGASAVLLRTANLVVRATLVQAVDRRATPVATRAGTASGWRVRLGGRTVGSIEGVVPPATPSRLRGGRIIGPLERGFVVVLALIGAWPALAALVAAKGIVRFPEINRDRASGSKAEEFLIGSLASWAVAGGVAALLALRLL